MEDLIQQLFAKYLGGRCTGKEIETLMAYFSHPENELLLKKLILAEMELDKTEQSQVPDLEARLSVIQLNVQNFIIKDRPALKLWFGYKSIAAVAAVVLVGGVTLMYVTQREQPKVLVVNAVNHIIPGKTSATLTLADGTKVLLNDAKKGEVVKQDGVTITKTADGKIAYKSLPDAGANSIKDGTIPYNNLSTANGEQYTIVLPDESTVTLNAASSITYPASFEGLRERKIELTGEAYFVVKHNRKQPFKVLSKGQEVEDIGTEFNVNSYADERSVKTTLVAGSARITSEKKDAVTLTPAQQCILIGNSLKISSVDVGVYVGWKDGLFAYRNTPLQEVMRQVSRWYDVKIVYQDQDLRTIRLTGSVSRYDTVTGILNAIAYTAKVRFKVDNRTIKVLKAD